MECEIAEFGERANRLRGVGSVTVLCADWEPRSDMPVESSLANAGQNLVVDSDLTWCSDSRFERVTEEICRVRLSSLFQVDLAYLNEVMTPVQAESLTSELFSFFGPVRQTYFLRNELSDATYQDGIVISDSSRVCIVWFEDED